MNTLIITKSRIEMAHEEATRDPIFLFQLKRRGRENWATDRVFWSRKEAEDYGHSREYAWGKMLMGWRVYCVCAEGHLAEVLRANQ